MRVVVVGGHTRNIGKTWVSTGLIREFKPLGWTAVKITQYGHGFRSLDGEPCGSASRQHAFVLTEEHEARGRGDTCCFVQSKLGLREDGTDFKFRASVPDKRSSRVSTQ